MTTGNGMVAYAIDVLGLTEADVRDVWMYADRDVWVIRTWNHRRYEANGVDVYRWFQSVPLTRKRWLPQRRPMS